MNKGKIPAARVVRGEFGNAPIRYPPRQFVPAKELAEALADAPTIDYEELRADIDAHVDQDPTPRYWVD
jgi:hypothetical protein